ncbi:hypothetical protein EB796_016608 [Bugula neritina]|uniref:Uncharacterized protein n=1 Tax=Bugula neritina TaxID=10212 RepID=A0A7J7JHK8_BUGNE|nr:hypothetical protein EB796_016608 [Bugula neritina]
MKVLNMLDEYGESPTDLYPSRHKGFPAHKQFANQPVGGAENVLRLDSVTPQSSPVSTKSKLFKEIIEPSRSKASIKQVEVQEVFDLEELSQNWDSTFITKPMYVWVPGKQKPRRRKRSKSSSTQANSKAETFMLKDVTNDLLPRQPSDVSRDPAKAKPTVPRSKSPLPTGGQPYSNVGQTPKDRMRFRVIMNELKDLPRPFVLEVLEKARRLDNKEDVLMLMERYLKTMRKSDWELSMVTGEVLQQQKMNSNMFGVTDRLRCISTNQVYKLDETDTAPPPLSAIPTEVMEGSISGSNRYKILPDIARRKKGSVRVHVSTTTQDSVKPFQYNKQSDMEFCLGPTRSLSTLISRPPSEEKSTDSVRDHGNAADLSVLYDQEMHFSTQMIVEVESLKLFLLIQSVERNQNTKAKGKAVRADGESAPNDSRTSSSVVPKAPAGTPYTPKTPFKDRNTERLPVEPLHSSPDGVGLEVIQEMTVVDEFPTDPKTLRPDPDLTTKSVIYARSVPSASKRRVVSANVPRYDTGSTGNRRMRSADVSLAVGEASSVGEIDQVFGTVPSIIPGRTTASRLDMASSASNWPIVDEEALLREQITPKPEPTRVASAPNQGPLHEKERRDTRPVTEPVTSEEEAQKTKIVVDLPPVTLDETSPAPPQPSPEPQGKTPRATTETSANQSESQPAAISQSDSISTVIPNSHLPGKPAVVQSEGSQDIPIQSNVSQPGTTDQREYELNKNMELNISSTNDPLSLVPEKLYREMDLTRDISLSADPPSLLVTPEGSPVKTRINDVPEKLVDSEVEKSGESAAAEENLAATKSLVNAMMQEDQGGLAG